MSAAQSTATEGGHLHINHSASAMAQVCALRLKLWLDVPVALHLRQFPVGVGCPVGVG